MTSDDLAYLPVSDMIAAYRRKTTSPVEVAKTVLDRIGHFNEAVNAYCYLDAETVLQNARESEARWAKGEPKGRLDGVPVGIKDNILVAGMPARFGSRLTANTPAPIDAPSVARLRESGALILGKTAMPEFGWKPVGDSPLTGITRNPWDMRKTPGGSSSGGAAAVVLGMGSIQIGTDGGGSIRIPAAFTGCYGIKPTRARVPAWPPSPLGTLGHVGPLTQCVADAALIMSVIAAPDSRDVYSWISPGDDFQSGLEGGMRGLRVAYSPRLGYARRIDPEVESAVAMGARLFGELGATVEQVDPELSEDPVSVWSTLWWACAATTLRPFGERVRSEADPELVKRVTQGLETSAVDIVEMQMKRAEVSAVFARFFERYDLLVTPTLPLPAFEAGHMAPPSGHWGQEWTDWTPFSYPFNLTQQPVASIPCGLTQAGLPMGLQIAGAVGADGLVLRASRAFEAAKPYATIREPRRH
jgi:aspartyl-tRNA(Asn)/glutamyl-tRNA(Gln) amidotransferase subunit A